MVFRFFKQQLSTQLIIQHKHCPYVLPHWESKLHSENPFGWLVFFSGNTYPTNVFTGAIVFAEA